MKTQRGIWALFILLGLLPFCILLSISVGTVSIHWHEVFGAVPGVSSTIVYALRVPRCILALMVGGGLALAGACYQGLLRNPLADPYVLGISSGASLGAVIAALWMPAWLSPFAFAGALLTMLCVMALAGSGRGDTSVATLILAGVIINALFSAAVTFGMLLLGESMTDVMFWLTGAIRPLSYAELGRLGIGWGALCLALGCYAPRLNVLLLGEEVARSLGLATERLRWQVFVLSSLLIGLLVSKSGIIGFVGLVVPHLVRLATGSDYRWLLPLSVLAGAELVLLADILGRVLGGGEEFPIGVLMALLGAPFFLWLLWRRQGQSYL